MGVSHTAKAISDGNLDWDSSTGLDFPLSTPVIGDSFHQQYIPLYEQPDSSWIQEYPDPNAVPMNSFDLSGNVQNMHINHQQGSNQSAVDDLAMITFDCSELPHSLDNFSDTTTDSPNPF
jgi:hypothetical protein